MLFQLTFSLTAYKARGSDTVTHKDRHKHSHTSASYCITKLSAHFLIKYLHSERPARTALFHAGPFAAIDQGILAANVKSKALSWTEAAPLRRVNNFANLESQLQLISFINSFLNLGGLGFFKFSIHCFPSSFLFNKRTENIG